MISLTSVFKCHRNSIGRRTFSTQGYKQLVNEQKAEAKKLILIENVGNNKQTKQESIDIQVFSDKFKCNVQKSWSWTLKRRNFFLLKLKSVKEVDKLQQNVGFNLHGFPIRTRMIESSLQFPTQRSPNSVSDPAHFNFNTVINRRELQLDQLRKSYSSEELIKHFQSIHSLSELDLALRYFLITQLEEVLCQGIFSDFSIYPFGSSLAGLGDSSSDLDIAMLKQTKPKHSVENEFSKPEVRSERDQTQQSLSLLADICRDFVPNFSNIQRILRARVPIVKMSFDLAPIQIDLSCELSVDNGHHGYIMANYLSYATKRDEKVKQLFVMLKLWARQHGLVKSQPGVWFTNFQIITLATYFLQSKGIIQSMECFEKNSRTQQTVTIPDIQQLLYEFFEFVVSFDFEKNGISILKNETFTKPNYSPIYIENPIEKELNICKNVNGAEFKKLLLTAYNSLDAMHSKDFHMVDLLDPEYLKKLEVESKA